MDEKAKTEILRLIPYGLYVLTARDADGVNAATVSWLSQASFEPPRIVVGLRRETGIWERVRSAGEFAVNVVGRDQKALAQAFFRHAEPEGDTLGGYTFRDGTTGAPILADVPATLECRVAQEIEAGDHSLFLADVIAAEVQDEPSILSLPDTNWHYGG